MITLFQSEFPIDLTEDDVKYIFQPVFSNLKQISSQFAFLDRLENLPKKSQVEIIDIYSKEATRIYQILPKLLGIQEITENFKKNERLDENSERTQVLRKKIDFFIESNAFIKIQPQDASLQISADSKLLVTPLAIFFIICHYSTLGPERLKIKYLLSAANSKIGLSFNQFSVDRVNDFLAKSKAPFSKKEVVISLLLLLSQSNSPDRTVIVGKSSEVYLQESLCYIANSIFGDALFSKPGEIDNSIRRSTGATGLDGKTSMLFKKEDCEDKTSFNLYFDLSGKSKSGDLLFIIAKLLEDLKTIGEAEKHPYVERVLQLIDQHINNRNLIFGSKPYVRQNLLSVPDISTTYLENLYSEMNNIYSNRAR